MRIEFPKVVTFCEIRLVTTVSYPRLIRYKGRSKGHPVMIKIDTIILICKSNYLTSVLSRCDNLQKYICSFMYFKF